MRFVAYDGEAVDDIYCLLANQAEHIYDPHGLTTEAALRFLTKPLFGESVRVWFAMDYDVNMIVRDIPDDLLEPFFRGKSIQWEGWRLRYLKSKLFSIGRGHKRGCTHFDIWSFFGCSFAKALEAHLGIKDKLIKWGKKSRSGFQLADMEKVIEYNRRECELLVELAGALKQMVSALPIPMLKSWHGPGAIALTLLKGSDAKLNAWLCRKVHHNLGEDFELAVRTAYYGGRSEAFQLGGLSGGVYRYDIRSAYPAEMVNLPRLNDRWVDWDAGDYEDAGRVSLWLVRFWDDEEVKPGVLPWRHSSGYISFPQSGLGWYWKDEVESARSHGVSVEVIRGYGQCGDERRAGLTDLVREWYGLRRELCDARDPAQYVLKIGLNSLYGKFAQKVGRPPFRNLIWAGLITAGTRIKVLAEARNDPGVVGFATDGIFSTNMLLHVKQGDGLGEWEACHYGYGLFLMPGLYQLDKSTFCRGYHLRNFPWSTAVRAINRGGKCKIRHQLFIRHPLAMTFPETFGADRLRFVDVTREFDFWGQFKRRYDYESLAGRDVREMSIGSLSIPADYGVCAAPCSLEEMELDLQMQVTRDWSDDQMS